jgi:endogenous inhibitor of DNA gyrase (YacG/DUF329 family)
MPRKGWLPTRPCPKCGAAPGERGTRTVDPGVLTLIAINPDGTPDARCAECGEPLARVIAREGTR